MILKREKNVFTWHTKDKSANEFLDCGTRILLFNLERDGVIKNSFLRKKLYKLLLSTLAANERNDMLTCQENLQTVKTIAAKFYNADSIFPWIFLNFVVPDFLNESNKKI